MANPSRPLPLDPPASRADEMGGRVAKLQESLQHQRQILSHANDTSLPRWLVLDAPLLRGIVVKYVGQVTGLRAAYLSPRCDQVLFVGDEWSHDLATKVGELLDAIGAVLYPDEPHALGGGLRIGEDGLDGYLKIPLA